MDAKFKQMMTERNALDQRIYPCAEPIILNKPLINK